MPTIAELQRARRRRRRSGAGSARPVQKFMTPAEAAKILGTSPTMVRRFCSRGQLRAERMGITGAWIIERQAVDDYLAHPPRRNRNGPHAPRIEVEVTEEEAEALRELAPLVRREAELEEDLEDDLEDDLDDDLA